MLFHVGGRKGLIKDFLWILNQYLAMIPDRYGRFLSLSRAFLPSPVFRRALETNWKWTFVNRPMTYEVNAGLLLSRRDPKSADINKHRFLFINEIWLRLLFAVIDKTPTKKVYENVLRMINVKNCFYVKPLYGELWRHYGFEFARIGHWKTMIHIQFDKFLSLLWIHCFCHW